MNWYKWYELVCIGMNVMIGMNWYELVRIGMDGLLLLLLVSLWGPEAPS